MRLRLIAQAKINTGIFKRQTHVRDNLKLSGCSYSLFCNYFTQEQYMIETFGKLDTSLVIPLQKNYHIAKSKHKVVDKMRGDWCACH